MPTLQLKLVQPGCLQGYKPVFNSSWHFTGSQVHVTGIPEKRDPVQCLLDPLYPPSPREGLAAILVCVCVCVCAWKHVHTPHRSAD